MKGLGDQLRVEVERAKERYKYLLSRYRSLLEDTGSSPSDFLSRLDTLEKKLNGEIDQHYTVLNRAIHSTQIFIQNRYFSADPPPTEDLRADLVFHHEEIRQIKDALRRFSEDFGSRILVLDRQLFPRPTLPAATIHQNLGEKYQLSPPETTTHPERIVAVLEPQYERPFPQLTSAEIYALLIAIEGTEQELRERRRRGERIDPAVETPRLLSILERSQAFSNLDKSLGQDTLPEESNAHPGPPSGNEAKPSASWSAILSGLRLSYYPTQEEGEPLQYRGQKVLGQLSGAWLADMYNRVRLVHDIVRVTILIDLASHSPETVEWREFDPRPLHEFVAPAIHRALARQSSLSPEEINPSLFTLRQFRNTATLKSEVEGETRQSTLEQLR
ncbi:hypothetical protein KGQ71_05335, partial [Patescibacteria group bacterium]|nr:hypothetical protein [Patescibacteria group bacterium]